MSTNVANMFLPEFDRETFTTRTVLERVPVVFTTARAAP